MACQKAVLSPEGQEIILHLDNQDLKTEVSTKATPITSIPGTLYWGATTGSSSETAKWATTSATVSSSKIATGKFQTYSATAYNYYVANANFTVGGNMTVSGNGTDIIAGRLGGSTSTAPSVTLGHIFARTGTLTLNVPSGYTASSVSWQIVGYSTVNGTAGTYNMVSQSWTSASTKLTSYTAITGTSDLWLIPGTYTVKVSFTLTKGDFSKAYTQTGNVSLSKGYVNNISATTSTNEAVGISFTTSVTAWTTDSASFTWPEI